MDLGLQGRTALVFGASGGLGSAIARRLAEEGANVALAGRRLDALTALAGHIDAQGGKAMAVEWDLADLGAIAPAVARIENALGPVDILVNNTGGPPPTPVAGQDIALWQAQFQAMVLSVISTTDQFLPGMKARQWGRIITSTSSGVVSPIPNLGLSNTLRLSLLGWSKTLAREVGRDGITANVIIPGRIATPRTAFLDEQKANRESRPLDDIIRESSGAIALGRYGEAAEYADTVAFVASARASYITGSVIRVDGGLIQNI